MSPLSNQVALATYARLNAMRSMVGAVLGKAGTPFGSVEERGNSAGFTQRFLRTEIQSRIWQPDTYPQCRYSSVEDDRR